MSVPASAAAVPGICSRLYRRIVCAGPLTHCLLIVFLGLAVYANSFRVPFLFDDISCIAENSALGTYFDQSVPDDKHYGDMDQDIINSMQLRVVTYATFALNYRLHGLDVAGYHVVNLLIHVTTAVLVYLLIATILRTPFFREHPEGKSFRHTLPLVVSLLFVSHPIQTSAVTYIAQRFTSLATLFYLLALVFYLKARAAQGIKTRAAFLAGSVAVSVVGMYTKEILFTLPVMAAVCELLLLKGRPGTRIKFLAPLLCTMAIIPFNTLAQANAVGGIINHLDDSINLANLNNVSQWEYFCTQFRVIVTYLRLLLLPINLHIDYDYPRFSSFMAPPVFVSFLLLLSVAASGGWSFLRSRNNSPLAWAQRLYAFGVTWFFVTISMSSSIIPLDDMIFEYRLYLPSTGFFLAVATLVLLAGHRLDRLASWSGKVAPAAIFLVIISLSLTTFSRNHVWGSTVSFWEDNVAKAPNKARPHYNLGTAYVYNERIPEAIVQYTASLKLAPTILSQHESLYNIARCYEELQRWDEAFDFYERALQIKPYHYMTLMYYGQLLATVGRYEESRTQFKLAERVAPYSK